MPGKRRRERPKRIFMDVAREDMQAISVTKQEARNGVNWKEMFCCGDT